MDLCCRQHFPVSHIRSFVCQYVWQTNILRLILFPRIIECFVIILNDIVSCGMLKGSLGKCHRWEQRRSHRACQIMWLSFQISAKFEFQYDRIRTSKAPTESVRSNFTNINSSCLIRNIKSTNSVYLIPTAQVITSEIGDRVLRRTLLFLTLGGRIGLLLQVGADAFSQLVRWGVIFLFQTLSFACWPVCHTLVCAHEQIVFHLH